MSVELIVYSEESAGISMGALVDSAKSSGWHLAVETEEEELLTESQQLLRGEYFAWGAQSADKLNRIVESLRDGGVADLERDSRVAACQIDVLIPFDSKEWIENDQELEELVGKEGAGWIRASRAQYGLRLAAGRSSLACELQEVIWKILGKQTRGVLWDPQECKITKA